MAHVQHAIPLVLVVRDGDKRQRRVLVIYQFYPYFHYRTHGWTSSFQNILFKVIREIGKHASPCFRYFRKFSLEDQFPPVASDLQGKPLEFHHGVEFHGSG